MLTRRACLCGAAAAATSSPAIAQLRSGLCQYSLNRGWSSSYSGDYIKRRARTNDPSGIPQVVDRIQRSLGFRSDFEILIAENENNAMAVLENGKRFLVIDVDFLDGLNRRTGTQWSAIQVIAHEVGHHIAGFSRDSHRSELNADYWSGQALQRLGSARDAATKCILAVGTETDSSSHPNKYRRASVIGRGWDDAARNYIDRGFCLNC